VIELLKRATHIAGGVHKGMAKTEAERTLEGINQRCEKAIFEALAGHLYSRDRFGFDLP
jgi:hypothetical protein